MHRWKKIFNNLRKTINKMKFEVPTRHQLADELKQQQIIINSLINEILYSKRLLIDHVQALEQCLLKMQSASQQAPLPLPLETDDMESWKISSSSTKFEIFTLKNACILIGSTLLDRIITPRALRFTILPAIVITTSFGTLYGVKQLYGFRNRIVQRDLENIIRTIDDFGNCIRRNITYFNEIIIMKQQELIESRQCERAWDCITAAKEVTEILFDATRKLESHYPLPAYFAQYYSPLEDLKECNYFKNNVTDYTPKHIKDFHNIFAYVQSQFLLRLALTMFVKPSLSQLGQELVKIDCLIRQLVLEEENHFKNLAIELNKKQALELETLNESRITRSRHDPVGVLQDSSLKLSACMVAVAGECQALDITLQRLNQAEYLKNDNAKHLVEVANNMRSIENALSNCFNDFQRLMLVYNKFLNSQLESDSDTNTNKSTSHKSEEDFPESVLRVEISQYPEAEMKDDFYAYFYDGKQQYADKEESSSRKQRDMEILNFEKRLTRGKFRPVLKQLKERIDPIKQVMLEKEREVLAAKGFNVDELFKKHQNGYNSEQDSPIATDSEGSADIELEGSSKKLHSSGDRFEEMRNFLVQKPNINLLTLTTPTPSNVVGSEDILESAYE